MTISNVSTAVSGAIPSDPKRAGLCKRHTTRGYCTRSAVTYGYCTQHWVKVQKEQRERDGFTVEALITRLKGLPQDALVEIEREDYYGMSGDMGVGSAQYYPEAHSVVLSPW